MALAAVAARRAAEPLEAVEVVDPASLALLASEVKLSILRHLADEALTVAEVARRLGAKAPAISFHVSALLAGGLVREVGSVPGRTRSSRVYRATARTFDMSAALVAVADPLMLAEAVAAAARSHARECLRAGGFETPTLAVRSWRLSPADAAGLARELHDLLARYDAKEIDPSGADPSVTVGLHAHHWRSSQAPVPAREEKR
ncbi:MAG: winged helix-turn-helix domain-containing protein [Nocardioides sp.]